jgi:excisionase family DNA binding protein
LTYYGFTSRLMSEMGAKRIEIERLAYGVAEAAKALGISYRALYTLIKSGHLRAVRVGRRIIIPKSALEELLGEKRGAE